MLIGGSINGQLITWDLSSKEHRIEQGKKTAIKDDEDEDAKGGQQAPIRMKHVIMSTIEKSHKSFISDIQFVPGGVKVDKRHANEGKSVHFLSVSEDGLCSIWDTRNVEINEIKQVESKGKHGVIWSPLIQI